ncbi:MAG: SOS response-associated peptidase family protein [bacterium]
MPSRRARRGCEPRRCPHRPPGTIVFSHNRMPVILEPRAYRPWLSSDLTDTEGLTQLLAPFPPENMKTYGRTMGEQPQK